MIFTQSYRVTREAVVKLLEATQMFVMVDYIREMTVKKSKYGKYGSFEHLLFLYSVVLVTAAAAGGSS